MEKHRHDLTSMLFKLFSFVCHHNRFRVGVNPATTNLIYHRSADSNKLDNFEQTHRLTLNLLARTDTLTSAEPQWELVKKSI